MSLLAITWAGYCQSNDRIHETNEMLAITVQEFSDRIKRKGNEKPVSNVAIHDNGFGTVRSWARNEWNVSNNISGILNSYYYELGMKNSLKL